MPENIVVNIEDFKQAASNFIPSISKKDLEYFNKLKSNFSPSNQKFDIRLKVTTNEVLL